jgi:hypothetical protein
VREAETQKAALDSYISRLTAVCNALCCSSEDPNHDTIEDAMGLTRNMSAGAITYQVIMAAKKKSEDDQRRAEVKPFFELLETYISKKDVSEGRKRSFRVLIRTLSRYQSFVWTSPALQPSTYRSFGH